MKKYNLMMLCLLASMGQAMNYAESKKGQRFITEFAAESDYTQNELNRIFEQVSKDEAILKKISRPAEKTTPWFKYKKIFADEKRRSNGIAFYKANTKVLNEAYDKYGVAPEIIVAIIGVETRYGKVMGKDKVISALATIGLDYPKREKFFTKELRAFLTMAKQENFDPLSRVGSYAGAMGMAQFMPSSYLHYAVDYEGDGKRDLWTNPNDAIFSIANYLKENGWQRDELIIDEAILSNGYEGKYNHKPFIKLGDLKSQGIFLKQAVALDDSEVGMLELDGETGKKQFITFKNFAVITTYNTSPMYALAVTKLGRVIKAGL